jgi:hypothetical protein
MASFIKGEDRHQATLFPEVKWLHFGGQFI